MKPHKHAELIKVWADGVEIQKEWITKGRDHLWIDDPHPSWHEDTNYRVKPREFEEGAWYPVVDKMGNRDVRVYICGQFALSPNSGTHELWMFKWVGDKLEINWPEE